MNFRGARKRPEATMEVTPLIDVVFLLLVFFLLTTTFARPTPSDPPDPDEIEEAAIEVQLAAASSGEKPAEQEIVSVFLDDQGFVYLDNEQPLAANELKARLLEISSKAETVVNLKADKGVSHGAVVELFDLVKESGIEKVNIIIELKK